MKGKSIFLLLIALTAAAGCGRTANRNAAEQAVTIEKQMTAPLEEATLLPSPEGVVNPVLLDGARTVTIRKTAGQPIYAEFSVDGYKSLHAEVTPVGTEAANLRISTITLPDGSTDGPFGRTLDREIHSAGKIRLEIGESLMQGDPWGGDFKLAIKLSR